MATARKRIDVNQVAAMIGHHPSTIRHWIKAGLMPDPAPPRKIEWYDTDIKQWIADNFDTT